MTSYTVELSEALSRASRSIPVVTVRRTARASVLVGVLLLLLAATALALVIHAWLILVVPFAMDDLWILVASLLLIAPAWDMVQSGRNRLRATKLLGGHEKVPTVDPYAFEITDTTLKFPSGLHRSAESWPPEQTTAKVERYLGQRTLTLHRAGCTTRRYPAKILRDPPEHVLSMLERISRP